MAHKFELGIEVKDVVTGFKGVTMARVEYLTGCTQYGVQPRALKKEGGTADWVYFDETRLVATGKGTPIKIVTKDTPAKKKGADLPPPGHV